MPSGRRKYPDVKCEVQPTPEQTEQLRDVMQFAMKVTNNYVSRWWSNGDEIFECVRARVMECIALNWTRRQHVTHRREIPIIVRRMYADEMQWRFGTKTKGRHLLGNHQDLFGETPKNGERREHAGACDDGGIADVEARIYLEQEAAALARANRNSAAAVAFVLSRIPKNATMQDIADEAGVSKATASRVMNVLEERLRR